MSVCAKTSKASRSAAGAGVLASLWQKHKRDKIERPPPVGDGPRLGQ